jgi:hypothetical protein
MDLAGTIRRMFTGGETPAIAEPGSPILIDDQTAELEGARARLTLAEHNLRQFRLERCLLIDGQWMYRSESIDGRPALDREHHALLVEFDSAARQFQKSLRDWAETHGG